jgi:hypothetical protein
MVTCGKYYVKSLNNMMLKIKLQDIHKLLIFDFMTYLIYNTILSK